MNKILEDIESGALPWYELLGFAWYLLRRASLVLLAGGVLATAVWLLTR